MIPCKSKECIHDVCSYGQIMYDYITTPIVGYHNKGYLNQSNKNHKRRTKPSANHWNTCPNTSVSSISGPNHGSPDPLVSGASSVSPDPPRARTQTPPRPTPLASGVSSVSPDPSRARAPTPLRPTRARLPTHGARTTTWQAQWLPYRGRAWWQLFQPP